MKSKIEDTKRTPVYFPLNLLTKLRESARENRRSLNQEVMYRLEKSFVGQEKSAHAIATSTGAKVTTGDLSPVKFDVKDSE